MPASGDQFLTITVAPTEMFCVHTHARIPSILVTVAPTATKWHRSSGWLPTSEGSERLASFIADTLTAGGPR